MPPDHISGNRQWQADPSTTWQAQSIEWQRYAMDAHAALLDGWRDKLSAGALVLKTDLFEEAVETDGLGARVTAMGWRTIGMDIGRGIACTARRRNDRETLPAVVISDVRQLAFGREVLSAIVSNSTLDHFSRFEDLDQALAELYRVLQPGGRLLLTLDNPRNPVIALRNALPRRLTDALGITNFYVGRTLSLPATETHLHRLGFEIVQRGTLMHAPRWPSLQLLRLGPSGRSSAWGRMIGRIMRAMECLGRWPTAQLTGNFIFIDARKPSRSRESTD